MFVFLIGIFIILLDTLRSPSIWNLLNTLASSNQTEGNTTIDNRIEDFANNSKYPDAFVAAKDSRKSGSGESDAPLTEGTERDDSKKLSCGLSPEQLASIADDRPSTRNELPLSLAMFNVLRSLDTKELEQLSQGRITYAQLLRQPAAYRGRLVTVAGVVRRAHSLDILPNEYGFKRYYQLWLFPNDNPTSPMVIFCLKLPDGFPTGMELAEEIEATGFFFKRLAYNTKDAVRIAPELLVNEIRWNRRPAMTYEEPAETWPIPLIVCLALAVALLTTLIIYLRTRATLPTLPQKTPDFSSLNIDQQDKPS